MMRVLALTNLFPNARMPHAAPFNRQQLIALSTLCDLDLLGTIPWFPGARLFPSSYGGRLVGVPNAERIADLTVHHPRYLYIPRSGYALTGTLYALSLAAAVQRYRGRIDVLLAAWAYPDGAAGVMLGKLLGVPVVVKCHGSDLNTVAKLWGPRLNLRLLLPRAERVIVVSRPLAAEAAGLGVDRGRIALVRNGVDTSLFRPQSRSEARAQLGRREQERLIVYVGRLEKAKGVLDLIDAYARASRRDPQIRLVLVGDGAARAECERRVRQLDDRVTLLGSRPLAEVPLWMAAADAVALASWAEGTPNVLLEAIACGRRAVATDVGGVRDVISSDELGEVVPPRDVDSLAAALGRATSTPYSEQHVLEAGRELRCSWAESAAQIKAVLEEAIAERRRSQPRAGRDSGRAHRTPPAAGAP